MVEKQDISWHMIFVLGCKPQADEDDYSMYNDYTNFDIYSMVHIMEDQKKERHMISQIFSSPLKMLVYSSISACTCLHHT